MTLPPIEDEVARYYTDKVRTHGAAPRGVDWNSAESQQLRFRKLLQVVAGDGPFTLTDYGCGYGALLDTLAGDRRLLDYQGFDISTAMVDAARQRHAARANCRFTTDAAELSATDHVVASGIFNVRLGIEAQRWRQYAVSTLQRLADLARVGFAFNMLTSYSDAERQRPDLYYADPMQWFDHCKRHLAPRVSLLHDYALWEFTILVWK
ncbi:MAG TPA: class I SAM-dependent methyltransferase [Planctomycetota bacterium]|nr:class I SAM-dependent methyltransferase [Planctomycetota bacterium]